LLVLDKVVVKRFWPADDKGEEDEIVRQVHLQIDAELDNSRQVGELFDSMVRGLVRISLVDSYTGEEYLLPAVTIKPFNVKQKKIKIGRGDETEIVKTEYASLTLVCRLPEEGGAVLADLYKFFNIELKLSVEPFRRGEQGPDSAGEILLAQGPD